MQRFAVVLLLLAACGAAPDKPMLANAPRPPVGAVAGAAAATAAAITLASPDTATVKPEKNQDEEKKPVEVKESVPPSVLDRLEKPAQKQGAAKAPEPAKKAPEPAGAKKADKPPKDALDFSQP